MEEKDDRNAHGFLRACYLNEELPVGVRMRAAGMAIGYESPKLEARANFNFDVESMKARLLLACKRREELEEARAKGPGAVMELVEGMRLIEGEVIEENGTIADPVPLRRL